MRSATVKPATMHTVSRHPHVLHTSPFINTDTTARHRPRLQRHVHIPSCCECAKSQHMTHRGTSQRSKTHSRLITAPSSPPHRCKMTQMSNNNCPSLGVRARNLHTPRTSRERVAASAASTSRHRCSADCHSTTVAAKLVIHDNKSSVSNNQWHTRVARLVACQPRAAPNQSSTTQII